MNNNIYKSKYLKYKSKYLKLKGGGDADVSAAELRIQDKKYWNIRFKEIKNIIRYNNLLEYDIDTILKIRTLSDVDIFQLQRLLDEKKYAKYFSVIEKLLGVKKHDGSGWPFYYSNIEKDGIPVNPICLYILDSKLRERIISKEQYREAIRVIVSQAKQPKQPKQAIDIPPQQRQPSNKVEQAKQQYKSVDDVDVDIFYGVDIPQKIKYIYNSSVDIIKQINDKKMIYQYFMNLYSDDIESFLNDTANVFIKNMTDLETYKNKISLVDLLELFPSISLDYLKEEIIEFFNKDTFREQVDYLKEFIDSLKFKEQTYGNILYMQFIHYIFLKLAKILYEYINIIYRFKYDFTLDDIINTERYITTKISEFEKSDNLTELETFIGITEIVYHHIETIILKEELYEEPFGCNALKMTFKEDDKILNFLPVSKDLFCDSFLQITNPTTIEHLNSKKESLALIGNSVKYLKQIYKSLYKKYMKREREGSQPSIRGVQLSQGPDRLSFRGLSRVSSGLSRVSSASSAGSPVTPSKMAEFAFGSSRSTKPVGMTVEETQADLDRRKAAEKAAADIENAKILMVQRQKYNVQYSNYDIIFLIKPDVQTQFGDKKNDALIIEFGKNVHFTAIWNSGANVFENYHFTINISETVSHRYYFNILNELVDVFYKSRGYGTPINFQGTDIKTRNDLMEYKKILVKILIYIKKTYRMNESYLTDTGLFGQ